MELIENSNSIVLRNFPDFDITHIFECGQCFRWDSVSPNSFVGVVRDKALLVEQRENEIEFRDTNLSEFEDFWREYFDLDRDYGKIKEQLSQDRVLREAAKFGWGIRILNQDIWECLISFIISANNRIPMIKRAVKNISKKYGSKIDSRHGEYYSFPTPEQLNTATIEDLEACGAGFRAKYIKNAVQKVLGGEIVLDKVETMDTIDAREYLQRLSGVGPKIADCVLLFSAKKHDAFPIDVWVKRVMEYFYSDRELKLNEIQGMANGMFGPLAGFAQQYLFYYARELKIGK